MGIEDLHKEGEDPMVDLMREKLRIIRYSAVRCSNYVWFHISAAAGQKNGQLNRKRNFEKANTRLPCIGRWVIVIIFELNRIIDLRSLIREGKISIFTIQHLWIRKPGEITCD